MSDLAPIELEQYIISSRTQHFEAKQRALSVPIGKAWRICHANKQKFADFFLHRTLPVSRVKIAAPIISVQRKGHERIGKVRK
jgi:hypothetical protein